MSNRIKLKPDREPDAGPAVAVAWIHEDEVTYSFFHSFVQMLGYDLGQEARVWRGGFIDPNGTTGDLAAGRNAGVLKFLELESEWLLWIDTDMGFEPDTVERLLEAADPAERPVVGALCFGQRTDETDGVGGYRPIAVPTIMDWTFVGKQGGFQVRWDYPRNTLTRVHGTGSACILIHRSVFERLRDVYEDLQRQAGVREDGDPRWAGWYTRVTNPSTGELIGEDLSFCTRLMREEIPVFVHTGIQTTHQKRIWLQEIDYWRQRALAPAPEGVAELESWPVHRFAIIPTHNRPERLRALVASLSTQADTIVVLDNASDPPVDAGLLMRAAGKTELVVITDPEQPPNLSRFWNVMFDRCAELAKEHGADAWDVASFNDDAIVPAGWYDTVSTVLRAHPTAAVAHTGTNPVQAHELIDSYPYPRDKRMCPWAFVVRGELGLRSDEDLRWFWFDDAFNMAAIDAGGVLAAPGPLVINAHAVQATMQNPALAEQAEKDRIRFAETWGQKL